MKQKHWRSKRVKSTLADRIGPHAARLWYTLSLQLQEAELKQLLRAKRESGWGGGYVPKQARHLLNFYVEAIEQKAINYWILHDSINLRHCKIERLKRFLTNLQ